MVRPRVGEPRRLHRRRAFEVGSIAGHEDIAVPAECDYDDVVRLRSRKQPPDRSRSREIQRVLDEARGTPRQPRLAGGIAPDLSDAGGARADLDAVACGELQQRTNAAIATYRSASLPQR